jgi:MYXO-CTERM domain-containing protein
MRKSTFAGLSVLAMICETTAAWGADFSVGPNGSDSATGASSAPWATIQHAVDVMQPGDSVTVADGSYVGFWMKNRQGDAQHRFTIRAQNPLGAKITGPCLSGNDPNDSAQLVSVSFATIDGFDVTGAPRAGISIRTFGDETGADTTDDVVQNCRSHDNGAGITAGRHDGIFTGFAQNVLIQANEVDHNSEHGIYVSNSADNPIVRGNRSHDNSANGLQINADGSTGGDGVISNWLMEDNVVYGNGGASAINLDGATFGILRNNLVYGNAKGGIALFMGDSLEASHDNVVVGNTVYDSSGTRFGIQIDDGADNNVVFDNVFWSAASGMEIGSVNGLDHDYNVVSSYSGGSASAHETSADPTRLFVDAAASDYHPGPALVGQGAANLGGVSAPSVDLAGNARPQAGGYDVGCYEHPGSSIPQPPTADGGADAGAVSTSTADAAGVDATPPRDSGGPTAMVQDAADGGTAADAGALGNEAGPPANTTPDTSNGTDASNGDDSASTPVGADGGADGGDDPASQAWGAGNGQSGGGCRASTGPVGASGPLLLALGLLALASRRRRPLSQERCEQRLPRSPL